MGALMTFGARSAWEFELANGHRYSLPMMSSLTVADAIALRGADEAAVLAFVDAHAPGLTDELTFDELAEVLLRWKAANEEAGSGESSASST